MDKKFIDELASQWAEHDPQSQAYIKTIISKYPTIENQDFYNGLLVGLLLPFESIKLFTKTLQSSDEATQALYYSILKCTAHSLTETSKDRGKKAS